MFTLPIFLLIAVPLLQANQQIKPLALEDEVREKLEGLRSTVQGAIYTGFDNLENLISTHVNYCDNTLAEGAISIQQGFESLHEQLVNIKDLAAAANQNVDECLDYNEPFFNDLPQDFIDTLPDCVIVSNREVVEIRNDARYYMDTSVNEVERFDFQITGCRGDFLCLSPIVNQIELAEINIPQKIDTEVDNAGGLLDNLKVTTEECRDAKISSFEETGDTLLENIVSCVNRLLS